MPDHFASTDALLADPDAPQRDNRVARLLVEAHFQILARQTTRTLVDLARLVDRVVAAGIPAPRSVVASVSRVAR